MKTEPDRASWARRIAWLAEHGEDEVRVAHLEHITGLVREAHGLDGAELPAKLLHATAAAETTGSLAPLTAALRNYAAELEEGDAAP